MLCSFLYYALYFPLTLQELYPEIFGDLVDIFFVYVSAYIEVNHQYPSKYIFNTQQYLTVKEGAQPICYQYLG